MVGSSLSDEETAAANARLKVGFVVLVASSMALMSLQFDPTLLQIAIAFGAGLLIGAALLWFVLRNLREFRLSLRGR